MDWQTCPCPSDTGLEDWQRLVENCQISRRLSSNWLKWIGPRLDWRWVCVVAVDCLSVGWIGLALTLWYVRNRPHSFETLRSVDIVLLFPVYWDNCLPIGV